MIKIKKTIEIYHTVADDDYSFNFRSCGMRFCWWFTKDAIRLFRNVKLAKGERKKYILEIIQSDKGRFTVKNYEGDYRLFLGCRRVQCFCDVAFKAYCPEIAKYLQDNDEFQCHVRIREK